MHLVLFDFICVNTTNQINSDCQGRIQDLKLAPVLGRGLGTALRRPEGPGQSPCGGQRGEASGSSWILEIFLGKDEVFEFRRL